VQNTELDVAVEINANPNLLDLSDVLNTHPWLEFSAWLRRRAA